MWKTTMGEEGFGKGLKRESKDESHLSEVRAQGCQEEQWC